MYLKICSLQIDITVHISERLRKQFCTFFPVCHVKQQERTLTISKKREKALLGKPSFYLRIKQERSIQIYWTFPMDLRTCLHLFFENFIIPIIGFENLGKYIMPLFCPLFGQIIQLRIPCDKQRKFQNFNLFSLSVIFLKSKFHFMVCKLFRLSNRLSEEYSLNLGLKSIGEKCQESRSNIHISSLVNFVQSR